MTGAGPEVKNCWNRHRMGDKGAEKRGKGKKKRVEFPAEEESAYRSFSRKESFTSAGEGGMGKNPFFY